MPDFRPVNAKTYYEFLPNSEHQCGDIWQDLPSMGLLNGGNSIHGIMVTPSCDVSNFKTETLSYLPILPLKSYFSTIGFLPVVRREYNSRISSTNCGPSLMWPEPGYHPPTAAALTSEINRLTDYLNAAQRSAKERDHIERAQAALRIAKACATSSTATVEMADLAKMYGNQWAETKKKIITNSFTSDIHFLPSDGQQPEIPGVKGHSVVLFRYPMTVPSEIMTEAQTTPEQSWSEHMQNYQNLSLAAVHFHAKRPMKVLSLKAAFLSDLLSRFTGLYSRIGSPDFSQVAIENMAAEMDR